MGLGSCRCISGRTGDAREDPKSGGDPVDGVGIRVRAWFGLGWCPSCGFRWHKERRSHQDKTRLVLLWV